MNEAAIGHLMRSIIHSKPLTSSKEFLVECLKGCLPAEGECCIAASESRRSIIGRRYDLSHQIYNLRDDNAPKSTKDEPKVVVFLFF